MVVAQSFLSHVRGAVARGLGRGGVAHRADRRDPRSQRKPGHRFRRLAGAQSAGSRGPGDLPVDDQPPGARWGEDGAREFDVRLLAGDGHFPGQDRQLLCTHPHSRTPEFSRRAAAPRRRRAAARAGRHWAGLGVSILSQSGPGPRAGRRLRSRAVARPAGLLSALRACRGAGRCGGRERRWVRAAISSRSQLDADARARRVVAGSHGRRGAEQSQRRRQDARRKRAGVRSARRRVGELRGRSRNHRAAAGQRDAGVSARCRDGAGRRRLPARRA